MEDRPDMPESFFNKHREAIGALIIVSLIFLFLYLKRETLEKDGVITVAKVLRFEAAESGSDLYIEIQLGDNKYITAVGQECQRDCIGNYFFVKVLRNDPADYPLFYGHNPVPSCIMDSLRRFPGWKKIPDCNNYTDTLR